MWCRTAGDHLKVASTSSGVTGHKALQGQQKPSMEDSTCRSFTVRPHARHQAVQAHTDHGDPLLASQNCAVACNSLPVVNRRARMVSIARTTSVILAGQGEACVSTESAITDHTHHSSEPSSLRFCRKAGLLESFIEWLCLCNTILQKVKEKWKG